MDRRGFLKVLGAGGVLVAAAPKLIVPPVRNVVANPERRVFLPPASGWLDLNAKPGVICEQVGRHVGCAHDNWTASRGQWTLRVERPWLPVDGNLTDLGGPVDIGGADAFLMERSVEYLYSSAVMVTERYVGNGRLPNLDGIRYGARVWLSVEPPRQLFQLTPIPDTPTVYIDALVEEI